MSITTNTNEIIPSHQNPLSPSSRPSPNPQACAACKHQRRKCTPDCLLAPYFPSSDPSSFLNAHRFFGVKKITKTLQAIHDPVTRNMAARSFVAHANARAADPSGGYWRVACELERKIEECSAELAVVKGQLRVYRAQEEIFFSSNGNGSRGVSNGDEQMVRGQLGMYRAQDGIFLSSGGGYNVNGNGDINDNGSVQVSNCGVGYAGEEQMIMKLLDEKIGGLENFEDDKKGSLFRCRTKFGVKEDVESKREVAQDEETESKVAASLNLSSLSDFIHKVDVER